MKPKPPKPIWCVVMHSGWGLDIYGTKRDAMNDYGSLEPYRIIRYIPAPPPKRRKQRRGYRAGGMS